MIQASVNLWVSPDYIMELLTALALQYLGIEFNECPNTIKEGTMAALITAAFGSSQDLPWFGLDQFRQACLQTVSRQYEVPLTLHRGVCSH